MKPTRMVAATACGADVVIDPSKFDVSKLVAEAPGVRVGCHDREISGYEFALRGREKEAERALEDVPLGRCDPKARH